MILVRAVQYTRWNYNLLVNDVCMELWVYGWMGWMMDKWGHPCILILFHVRLQPHRVEEGFNADMREKIENDMFALSCRHTCQAVGFVFSPGTCFVRCSREPALMRHRVWHRSINLMDPLVTNTATTQRLTTTATISHDLWLFECMSWNASSKQLNSCLN